MIPVPVLTPRLSSLWLWLVTPVYAGVGRKLVDSPPERDGRRGRSCARGVPVRPRGIRDAIARALAFEDRAIAQTRWSDEAFAETPSYGGVRRARAWSTLGRRPWRCSGARVRADPGDRRRDGLVQGRCAMAAAWPARRARRRAGASPGTTRSARARGRRHRRFLARRGVRARPTAAASRRDEGAGARVAAVRGVAGEDGAARRSPRPRSSIRPVFSASSTGTRCGRSTATSSAACCATSSPRRKTFEPDAAFETDTESAQTRHTFALACFSWRRPAE